MSERRRDIQSSPVESGSSGSFYASISPKAERETPAAAQHLETFPIPRRTFEHSMEAMRARLVRGEEVRALELITTFESYFARDLDRERALRKIEKLVAELKTVRERRGDRRMIEMLTKRLYARGFNLQQNTMLGLFTKPERGNCQATAKAASTILEEVGLDPQTQIAHQMFSDHVRTVAKLDGRWWVLEGKARPMRTGELDGTTLVFLQDEKHGLLEHPLHPPMGEVVFHKKDGQTRNPDVFAWIQHGLPAKGGARERLFPFKTPPIHTRTGERPYGLVGLSLMNDLIGSLLPLSPRKTKLVASGLAALVFLHGANRYRDPEVETMEDLSQVIRKDVETTTSTIKTAIDEFAVFMSREIEDLKSSAALEPLPKGSRRRQAHAQEPREPMKATLIDKPYIDELDRRMASYYGLAHYLLVGEGYDVESLYQTGGGTRHSIKAPPEAKTIGRDLYRYIIANVRESIKGFTPPYLAINFRGENLHADARERAKLQEVVEGFEKSEFPDGCLEFQINGETVGTLGHKPETRKETLEDRERALLQEALSLIQYDLDKISRSQSISAVHEGWIHDIQNRPTVEERIAGYENFLQDLGEMIALSDPKPAPTPPPPLSLPPRPARKPSPELQKIYDELLPPSSSPEKKP